MNDALRKRWSARRLRVLQLTSATVFGCGMLLTVPGPSRNLSEAALSPSGAYIPGSNWVNSNTRARVDVTHTFLVYNARLTPLVLKVEPSCGCTRAWPTDLVVGPLGCGAFTVNATMDGTNRKDEREVGLYCENRPNKPWLFAFLRNKLPSPSE